jgi:hypothetical protein
MTDTPAPPPGWAAAASRAAREFGLDADFPAMDPASWDQVCRRAGAILADQGQALPVGWEDALARAAGRTDPAGGELARDEADTILAEKGEVFAPEDDA